MSRYSNREQYFLELARTSRNYYLDYLAGFKKIDGKTSVLEIGCGEGGNLLPFAEMGCRTTGIDIAGNKIENARQFFRDRGLEEDFLCVNILEEDIERLKGQFDLILVHDVIEHISPDCKDRFIGKLKYYLRPDGIAFFAFPAWMMPFGGHQQICRSKVCSRLPFMHLLPRRLYRGYLKMFKVGEGQVSELLDIQDCRMTIEHFEKICKNLDYRILDRTLWFINPHYEAKFNLKPRKLFGFIAGIPFVRNFFSTSCFYLISQ